MKFNFKAVDGSMYEVIEDDIAKIQTIRACIENRKWINVRQAETKKSCKLNLSNVIEIRELNNE